MKTVPVTEFKANCPRLMDEVSQTGEPLFVTKRGKPFVEIHPVDKRYLRDESVGDRDSTAT